ncbi:uncharacterized protein [Ptychodera flava]|uniref:uncharacterized protein n=1 Tax=Ptychodera flava TaxID=63121 RepID=UPI003969F22E
MAFSAPIDPQFNQELRTLLEERQEELFETFSSPESRANSQGSTENVSEDCIRHDANDDEDDSDEDEPLTEADPTELARFYSQTHPEMVHEDDHREDDDDDLDKSSVEAVFRTGCGCKHQCYTNFSVDRVLRYIHNLGEKRFKNLKAHYKTHGVVPRDHGRRGKRPVNAYSFEVVQDVVKFLLRYADDNGLPMPAAPHGRDGRPPVYLPSCDTKADVYKKYVNACKVCQPAKQSVGETTFRNIWKLCVPHIQRMEPRTDVCAKCEHFRNEIQFATTEEDKLNSSIAFSGHILKAQKEREFLNSCIKRAQDEVTDITVQPPCSPCSLDLHNVHYTFDFAQSFLLPHQSRQVSPLYFLNPLRVNCFGVCNDSLQSQMNYLFDESQTIGIDNRKCHGANNVVSMLHNYFDEHGLGERGCHCNADNCAGQNKNKTVIHYFCYRTSTGLHDEINYHFLEPGHTKCICDACFGKIRQVYRRSDVDTVSQLADIVSKSSRVNKVKCYGSQNSARNFQWFQWDTFFSTFLKPLKGIRYYHHFRFTKDDPGAVYVRKIVTDDELRVNLVKRNVTWPPSPQMKPSLLPPGGLSLARWSELNKDIIPFVRQPYRHVFCPEE